MRTKAQSLFVGIFETWLNMESYDNEFFDTNLSNVFRKDRDSNKHDAPEVAPF